MFLIKENCDYKQKKFIMKKKTKTKQENSSTSKISTSCNYISWNLGLLKKHSTCTSSSLSHLSSPYYLLRSHNSGCQAGSCTELTKKKKCWCSFETLLNNVQEQQSPRIWNILLLVYRNIGKINDQIRKKKSESFYLHLSHLRENFIHNSIYKNEVAVYHCK